MTPSRTLLLTAMAMIAFAANSIFCRIALTETNIDPASFTSLRIISGALTLWLITLFRKKTFSNEGNWLSAISLFVYCAGFSFAYIELSTGAGALLLFGAVQLSMLLYGLYSGEKLSAKQAAGLFLAVSGVVMLMLPGLSTPPFFSAIVMVVAGIAWAIYTLRGKFGGDAINNTTGNFIRASVITLLMSLIVSSITLVDSGEILKIDMDGVGYALLSGAIASGVGYAIWYSALPYLQTIIAASVQLTVPVIAAIAGALFLNEPLTLQLVISSFAIIGGIALINHVAKV